MPRFNHPISQDDSIAMDGIRATLETLPPLQITPDARPFFDQMIEQAPAAEAVVYEAASVGEVPGWWCRPSNPAVHAAILYLHGGGYVIGSAASYRRPVGHLVAQSGVSAFVADYRLAPEQPFPAALDDALAAYQGLVDLGFSHIVVAGDSAGGGLSLALSGMLAARGRDAPAATIAISPLTDLTASGQSHRSRASADPLLSRDAVLAIADMYLAGEDSCDPRASPLFGQVSNLPPVLIHVGEDEVLLDDSLRYAELAESAGASVDLHVWEGMLHVFTSSIAVLEAAREAMGTIGEFIRGHTALEQRAKQHQGR